LKCRWGIEKYLVVGRRSKGNGIIQLIDGMEKLRVEERIREGSMPLVCRVCRHETYII
jgi:hypothetical protein